jgi:hypothetical protein
MTRNRGTEKSDFHEYSNGGFDSGRAGINTAFIWFCFQREPRTAKYELPLPAGVAFELAAFEVDLRKTIGPVIVVALRNLSRL